MKLKIKKTTAEVWVGTQEHVYDGSMNIPHVPEVSVSTSV